MTVCPIAILASCKKCPAFTICPAKGILGDYKPQDNSQKSPENTNKTEQNK